MKIFGPGWVDRDIEIVEVPVGESCAACRLKIGEKDQGIFVPGIVLDEVVDQPWHVGCFLDAVGGGGRS